VKWALYTPEGTATDKQGTAGKVGGMMDRSTAFVAPDGNFFIML
jgi:hypothetical protein